MRELAKRLGATYLARRDNAHAKAGNMNFGLKYSKAEFVIFLDSDFVCQPNFIERTLGYFRDKRLAFVQTPQVFYNTDSIQHRSTRDYRFWNEQTMFYESIQLGKNRYNAAFFCGTSALLRRAAIDNVGGFATGTATEDIHTSLRFHAKGWRSLYLDEKLAFGLAPEDLKEYHRQRVRWGAGSLGLLLRSPDSPLWARGLSLGQRLCYIDSTASFFQGSRRLIFYTWPVITLFTLTNPVPVPLLSHLAIFLPFFTFSMLAVYISSRRTYRPFYTEQFNVANLMANLASLKAIFKVQKKFGVSVKGKQQAEYSLSHIFIVLIFSVMVTANLAGLYWLLTWSGPEPYWTSAAGAALFWNNFNLIFVWLFLRHLRRFHRRHKQRVFKPLQPFRIKAGSANVRLAELNLTGARLITDQRPTKSLMNLLLPAANNLSLLARVQSVTVKPNPGTVIDVTFEGLSAAQRAELITFIFRDIVGSAYQKQVQELKL